VRVIFYSLGYQWCKACDTRPSIFTSAKEVMILPDFVCLSVCLCVSKISQKLMDGSFWNFQEMSGMGALKTRDWKTRNWKTRHQLGNGKDYQWFNFGGDPEIWANACETRG